MNFKYCLKKSENALKYKCNLFCSQKNCIALFVDGWIGLADLITITTINIYIKLNSVINIVICFFKQGKAKRNHILQICFAAIKIKEMATKNLES